MVTSHVCRGVFVVFEVARSAAFETIDVVAIGEMAKIKFFMVK